MRRTRSSAHFTLSEACCFLLVLVGIGSPLADAFPMPAESDGSIALVPEAGHLGPLRTLTLWQLPKGRVRKVLLILGGINSIPYDWWDRSPKCSLCNGLPENRLIVKEALSNDYAVVMPFSLDPDGDWIDWPEDSPDLVNVLSILSEWKLSIHGLEHVPTVALGVSAGGRCLSVLGLQRGLLESMVLMVSHGRLERWEAATSHYPPTLFIHMPKDTLMAEHIRVVRLILESKGVVNGEVPWYEHPLAPDWFSRAIVGLDFETSNTIFDALKKNKSIVAENDFPKTDQFQYVWNDILPPRRENAEKLLFEDAVVQEIKVAYAYHVTIARRNRDLFAWFEGAYKTGQNAMLELVTSTTTAEHHLGQQFGSVQF